MKFQRTGLAVVGAAAVLGMAVSGAMAAGASASVGNAAAQTMAAQTTAARTAVAHAGTHVVAVVAATPAVAQAVPSGTGRWCNPDHHTVLCMSSNGHRGQAVYGRALAHNNAEIYSVRGANVCKHNGHLTDIVQSRGYKGDTTNCPMPAALDNQFRGHEVQTTRNVHSGLCNTVTVRRGVLQVLQEFCGSGAGRLWIAVPVTLLSGKVLLEQWSVLALERGSPHIILSGGELNHPLRLLGEPVAPQSEWVRHP